MTDLIVFSVATNKYAINIENVQRIIESTKLTNIPNSHEYIDGMLSYEDKVIKVLNFRKLINLETYIHELEALFSTLKEGHAAWVSELKISLETGTAFTKTLNPHACGLGKWIDSFTAYDDYVVEILNNLIEHHKQLHLTGAIALETYKRDKGAALDILNDKILAIYKYTMGALDTFVKELDIVANSLQKLIIFEKEGVTFAIKVDRIDNIVHVEESSFMSSSEEHDVNSFLELDGILEIDSSLINVIKTVKLPK